MESTRKSLVSALKTGYDTAFYFGKMPVTTPPMDAIFGKEAWYHADILYTPAKVTDKDWYRAHLIKEEENIDNFGNKGVFCHCDKFKLGFIFEGKDDKYEEFISHHKLNKDKFIVMIVE